MENKTVKGDIGFCGLLTIVFIALKLMGYINWSWAWVLSPLWIPLIIVLVLLFLLWVAWIVTILKD